MEIIEDLKKRLRDFGLLRCLMLFVFFVSFITAVAGPTWLHAWYDMAFAEAFTSDKGKFSVKVPKDWQHTDIARKFYVGDDDNTYLSVRDAVYRNKGRGTRELKMYADMTVSMAPLSRRFPAPSPTDLHDALNTRLAVGREKRKQFEETIGMEIPLGNLDRMPTNTHFEVKWINGSQWVKTTITVEHKTLKMTFSRDPSYKSSYRTFIFWQTVDYRSNHYTVAFATDRISYYGPIFENIMKSFSFDS